MKVQLKEAVPVRAPRITLRQWRMLLALRDCGTFSEAACFLNLSQSTISHAVSKLQDQLGLPLLRIEGRKAHITDVGLAMLKSSERLIRDALELEAYAENVRVGKPIEINIAVDHYFPPEFIFNAVQCFTASHPEIKFTLQNASSTETKAALEDGQVDLAICCGPSSPSNNVFLSEIDYVAVAHSRSTLLKLERPLSSKDFEEQVEIVVGRSNEVGLSEDHVRPRMRFWSVCSIDAAVSTLSKGMGYAWLPLVQVQPLIAKGILAQLPVLPISSFKKLFYLEHGHRCGISPYIEQFSAVLSKAVRPRDYPINVSNLPPYACFDRRAYSERSSA